MDFSGDAALRWFLGTGIGIAVVIVASLIAVAILRLVIARLRRRVGDEKTIGVERAKRIETLTHTVETTVRILIFGVALMMILELVGIKIGPLLAGAGIIGLAVSFGAQSLVKDVINGFFILLQNDMNVGDVVEIAGVSGLVERINLRVTILRDLEGRVHIVPNGSIGVITNMTKEWARAVVDVRASYREDIGRIIETLHVVGEEMRRDPAVGPLILEPMSILGVDSFGELSLTIRIALKTQPNKQWDVARALRRRIKEAFDERGIEMTCPLQTLAAGADAPRGVPSAGETPSP